MKLFNIIALGLSVLSSLTLVGGQTPNCGATRATLTAVTNVPNAPFESVNARTGVVEGFDAEILCQLRARLTFADAAFINVTPFSFDGFVAQLNNGRANIAIGGISITPARLAQAAAIKYLDNLVGTLFNQAKLNALPAATQAALRNGATTLATLNTGNARVGVPSGSIFFDLITANYPNIDVVQFDTTAQAVTALNLPLANEDQIFAFVADEPVVTNAVTDFPTPVLEAVRNVTVVGFDSVGLGIFVNATCCQLYVDIRQAIADMAAEGVLQELAARFRVGTFTPGADLTPVACQSTTPNLFVRCPILQRAFAKFCRCLPRVVATIPATV